MSPIRFRVAVVVAAIGFSLVAVPAFAAPGPRSLPPGDSMFAADCGSSVRLQVWSVDASSALMTPLGAGDPSSLVTCAQQPAWDAATRTAYYIATTSGPYLSYLATVDTTTGVTTLGPQMTLGGANFNADSIAISPTGAAYASLNGLLYNFDLTSGAATSLIGPTGALTGLYSLAFDPTSGTLWGLESNGLLYTINPTTGIGTLVTTLALTPSNASLSMQVDSSGILWIENDTRSGGDLWSVDPTAGSIPASAISSGSMHGAVGSPYSEAFLITTAAPPPAPAPAAAVPVLGETGVDTAKLQGGLALAGALLVAGIALRVSARGRKVRGAQW